jgi:hypothetical protein
MEEKKLEGIQESKQEAPKANEIEKLLKKAKDEKATQPKNAAVAEAPVALILPEDISEEESSDSVKVKVKPRGRAKAVDISKLNILNKTEIDKERDLRNALYGNKAAFQIVAAQSGYMAKVIPLVHKDVVNILYGNLGRYDYRKSIFKVIYDKIIETSVGKMEFDNWLKVTSVEDMETFYYGVYAATFPNEGAFKYTCQSCDQEHEYTINHANLIKTADKEKMKQLIDNVSRNATSEQQMREFSLLGKMQAIQLNDSKIVAELKTPSLFDSLEILRTVPEKTIDKDAISVTNMLYINKTLIPTKEGNGFIEEPNKTAILRIIDSLPIEDAKELEEAVSERVEENRITYSIKNIKCANCGHEVKDIPISIEDILFTLIFEKAQ